MIRIFWQKGIEREREHEAGRALLARILGKEPQIRKGPYGKPYLEEGTPFFNLSHSGGFLAIAVGERELGLDLEAPRKLTHTGFVHPGEEGIDPLTLWVVKESFMKYTGEGIRKFRAVRAAKKEENLYRVTDGEQTAWVQTFQIENCIAAVAAAEIEQIKREQIG